MCWLIESKKYSAEDSKHYEGAFTQGNGYMNVRGSFEEELREATQDDIYWRLPANVTLEKARHPKSKWGVYIPGIYGKHPILGEEIVNLPYFLGLNLYINETRLDMEASNYHSYNRSLNMRNGVLERKLIWNSPQGEVALYFKRYSSVEHKNLFVQEIQVTPLNEDIELSVENFLDAAVTTNGYNHFTETHLEYDEGIKAFVTTDTQQKVGIYSIAYLENGIKTQIEFFKDKGKVAEYFKVNIKNHQTLILKKHSIMVSSIDEEYEEDISLLLNKKLNILKTPITMDKHEELWGKKWHMSDVVIEGDEKAQLAVRFSIYHLLRSANESEKVAIDAKAYAGEAYFGHYFWDTEVYLLPFYIYTQPQYAKKLLLYRYNTLQGAMENAKKYGYKGARYPWESCVSGLEQCSNWQYADLEIHVTADIVYGMWHYYKATGDEEFLFNYALPVMIETSKYWTSRVDKVNGSYRLMGVMGPDEYLPFTNDNAFTNYMVKFSLSKTLETLNLYKQSDKKAYDTLEIDEEYLNTIETIARELVFNHDKEKKFINQCTGFEDFLDIDFDEIWLDRSKPFGKFISQEKNYRSKALKQADVVALLYLFKEDFDGETKRNCADYYERITTHDSSLSYIFHSLLYCDLKEDALSYEFFNKALDIDLYNKGCAEGIHIANCGGIWQSIVMGFCGLSSMINMESLNIAPKLPSHIEKIEFKTFIKGEGYHIVVKKQGVDIKKI